MKRLTRDTYGSFVRSKTVVAVHFDAVWDVGHRPHARQRMEEAEAILAERAGFGEVDIDEEVELAQALPVGNVPTVAYYRDGKLVAALIGNNQNVAARVACLLRGEGIGRGDGTEAQ